VRDATLHALGTTGRDRQVVRVAGRDHVRCVAPGVGGVNVGGVHGPPVHVEVTRLPEPHATQKARNVHLVLSMVSVLCMLVAVQRFLRVGASRELLSCGMPNPWSRHGHWGEFTLERLARSLLPLLADRMIGAPRRGSQELRLLIVRRGARFRRGLLCVGENGVPETSGSLLDSTASSALVIGAFLWPARKWRGHAGYKRRK
jgi:hypothetical protein